MGGAISKASQLMEKYGDKAFMPQQLIILQILKSTVRPQQKRSGREWRDKWTALLQESVLEVP